MKVYPYRQLSAAVVLAAGAVALSASRPAMADEVGLDELTARLGTAVPTGSGVSVCQIEAPLGQNSNYGPNLARSEYTGKSFTPMSGTMTLSSHADTVGAFLYGIGISIAPGIPAVYNYEASGWINAFLRFNQSAEPASPPGGSRIQNHSWIANPGVTTENQILRRMDFQADRDGTLHVVGLNNGTTNPVPPLLVSGYNAISVGRVDGQHSAGLTPTGIDGSGRMKPEIVAPGDATSWATPVVAAAAALLHEVGGRPPLSLNPNAIDPTVTKAVLMAGAQHQPTWSNQPSASGTTRGEAVRPLDPVYGAGIVNVDRSHRILTGGEQDGSIALPAEASLRPAGWDFGEIGPGTNMHWRMRLTRPTDELSVVATWRRRPSTNFTVAASSPTVRLRLFRVDGTTLVPLTGDGGLPYFASGNVTSTSASDNVQHLYVRGLQPGEYAIQVSRLGTSGAPAPIGVAWFRPAPGGDINWDGAVDGLDLSVVLSAWGSVVPVADLNGDGAVDGLDLAVILANWG